MSAVVVNVQILSLLFACLSVCLFVCFKSISKTTKRIWQKFCTQVDVCPRLCLTFWWQSPQGVPSGVIIPGGFLQQNWKCGCLWSTLVSSTSPWKPLFQIDDPGELWTIFVKMIRFQYLPWGGGFPEEHRAWFVPVRYCVNLRLSYLSCSYSYVSWGESVKIMLNRMILVFLWCMCITLPFDIKN